MYVDPLGTFPSRSPLMSGSTRWRHASWKTAGIIAAFMAHVRSSLQERVPLMLFSDGGPPTATEAACIDHSMR